MFWPTVASVRKTDAGDGCHFSQPGSKDYWSLRKHWFGVDFREFLDARLADHEPKDMHYIENGPTPGTD